MVPRLKVTMQSLVYPAFLGSFLFAFLQRVSSFELTLLDLPTWLPTSWPWGEQEWLGLLLLIYFGTLYVETEATELESYGFRTFLIDVIEVASMVIAFQSLGFFGNKAGNPQEFFLAAAVAFACPVIWRLVIAGARKDFYDLLCFFAIIVALRAALVNQYERWTILFLWVLLSVYVIDLAISRAWLSRRSTGKRCFVAGRYRAVIAPKENSLEAKAGTPFTTYPETEAACTWQLEKVSPGFMPKSLIALGVAVKPYWGRLTGTRGEGAIPVEGEDDETRENA